MLSPEIPTPGSGIAPALRDRWDAIAPEWRRKTLGFLLALGIEALLILLLLSLGIVTREPVPMSDSLVTVTVSADNEESEQAEAETAQKPDRNATAPQVPQVQQPEPETPQPVAESAPVPALIPVSPDAMRSFDIARAPTSRPTGSAQPVGPANTPRPGDSERLAGSGPNGEPLYAARWYREPREDELRGYLSTASGPGWALINCRTASQYRVEDCVLVAEFPQGSNMGRAVLAAAWQFKVRPPQIGGRPQVGEWVRIRIVYDLRQAPAYPR